MPAPRPIHPSIHHLACLLPLAVSCLPLVLFLFSLFLRLHRVQRVRSAGPRIVGSSQPLWAPYGVASGTVVHHAAGYSLQLLGFDGCTHRPYRPVVRQVKVKALFRPPSKTVREGDLAGFAKFRGVN
jgi:hypothetical protein